MKNLYMSNLQYIKMVLEKQYLNLKQNKTAKELDKEEDLDFKIYRYSQNNLTSYDFDLINDYIKKINLNELNFDGTEKELNNIKKEIQLRKNLKNEIKKELTTEKYKAIHNKFYGSYYKNEIDMQMNWTINDYNQNYINKITFKNYLLKLENLYKKYNIKYYHNLSELEKGEFEI